MLPVAKNALKSARIDSKIFLKIPRTDETRDSTDEVMELILIEILRTGGDLICVIAYFRVRMGVILPIDGRTMSRRFGNLQTIGLISPVQVRLRSKLKQVWRFTVRLTSRNVIWRSASSPSWSACG